MEGDNSGGYGGGLVQRLHRLMFFGGWWRWRSKSVRAAICCLDIDHASENGVKSFRIDHRFFTSSNVEASVKTPRACKNSIFFSKVYNFQVAEMAVYQGISKPDSLVRDVSCRCHFWGLDRCLSEGGCPPKGVQSWSFFRERHPRNSNLTPVLT